MKTGQKVLVTLACIIVVVVACSHKAPQEPTEIPMFVVYRAAEPFGDIRTTFKPGMPMPMTTIDVALPQSGRLIATLENATGYYIKTLFNDHVDAGIVGLLLDMTNEDGQKLKSGLYYVTISFLDYKDDMFFGYCTSAEDCEAMVHDQNK